MVLGTHLFLSHLSSRYSPFYFCWKVLLSPLFQGKRKEFLKSRVPCLPREGIFSHLLSPIQTLSDRRGSNYERSTNHQKSSSDHLRSVLLTRRFRTTQQVAGCQIPPAWDVSNNLRWQLNNYLLSFLWQSSGGSTGLLLHNLSHLCLHWNWKPFSGCSLKQLLWPGSCLNNPLRY